MRRSHDVGPAGEQAGATGTGPGTSAGAQATGGGQPVSTESGTPYTTTTTAETRERGRHESTYYGRGAGNEGRAATGPSTQNNMGGIFTVIAGLLTFLVGLAFVLRSSFYHSLSGYAYNWSIHSWGWVLFGLGIATFAVGVCALLGLPLSRPLGVAVGVLTIVAGFMIIAFYPLWGIIIAAAGAVAVWGLLHGSEEREYERAMERDRSMRM